jgi:hypothetical protein
MLEGIRYVPGAAIPEKLKEVYFQLAESVKVVGNAWMLVVVSCLNTRKLSAGEVKLCIIVPIVKFIYCRVDTPQAEIFPAE